MAPKNDPELVTKSRLQEAVDTILEGVNNLVNDVENSLRNEMRKGFERVDSEISDLRHDVNNLKYDTPTMKEFNSN